MRLQSIAALATVADGKFVPVPGGVLVMTEDGTVIGAVGVSGDTSEKDEYCAITAIIAAGFQSEPEMPDDGWRNSSLSGASAKA